MDNSEADFSIVTRADLIGLRDLIVKDPYALERWPQIVDHIVNDVPDHRRIKQLYQDGHFEEAILVSLDRWAAYGNERMSLKKIFKKFKLNTLIREVEGTPLINRQLTNTSRPSIPRGYSPSTPKILITLTGVLFCAFAVVSYTFISPIVFRPPQFASPSKPSPADGATEPDRPVSQGKLSYRKTTGGQGQVQEEILRTIRNLVISDPIALQKWSSVVDYIVQTPPDEFRIKSLMRKGEYEEAVLVSLRVWFATGEKRPDLLQVLREQGLHLLADQINAL